MIDTPPIAYIGITGNFGCGKSLVCDYIAKKGYSIINADTIAHQALAPGTSSYQKIIDLCTENICTFNQMIDHKKLANIIFNNPNVKTAIEAIIHPFVKASITDFAIQCAKQHQSYLFIEIPLLFEVKWQTWMDYIIVIDCDYNSQINRLLKKGFSQMDIDQRLKSQHSMSYKKKHAHWIIDNSGSMDQTFEQVIQVLKKLHDQELLTAGK